jgi:serine/threonine protein phosphatase 1
MAFLTKLLFRKDTRIIQRRRVDLGPNTPSYPLYAIGDVHGCLDLLLSAEQRIFADMKATGKPGLIILLGDYIDRGPQSAAVLEHLSRDAAPGVRRLPLCGNHEEAFLQFLRDPGQLTRWLDFGGKQTLQSYGIDVEYMLERTGGRISELKAVLRDAVPEQHVRFLTRLPTCLRIGNYFFVHAGVRPDVALDEQADEDLMWIREPFLSRGPGMPLTVVHGHTPIAVPDFGANRIGIDTGAFMTGQLTVLKIEANVASVLS